MFNVLRKAVVLTFFFTFSAFAHSASYTNNFNSYEFSKSVKCLTDNIYYESGNQSVIGKVAVAYTTINRVLSNNFPDSVCEVVYEKTGRVCQFTWVCEHRRFKPIHGQELRVYRESKQVAIAVLLGYNKQHDPTRGALFYHAYYVNPGWRLRKLIQIEDHIFYK